jgi:hypothetical protein
MSKCHNYADNGQLFKFDRLYDHCLRKLTKGVNYY